MSEGLQRRARLVDIASTVGCSISTVSRVLSGRGAVSAELSARIHAAARALGYNRADETRGGRPGATAQVIDLVLPGFSSAWANRVIAGAQAGAFEHGYDLVLNAERDEPGADWSDRILRRGTSGLVVALIRPTGRQLDMLREANFPMVLIDPSSRPSTSLPTVATADWQGGFDAGAHLGTLGRARAIALAGIPRYSWGRARLDGVRAGLASTNPGSSFEVVDVDWAATDSMSRALRPVLDTVHEPAVLFTNTDTWAHPVYEVAAEAGLRIPDDLAVMGFDDDPNSQFLKPPLTTMRQPLFEIAELAVSLVVEQARGRSIPGERFEVPSTLIPRESTRAG